jgi:hypothetical protein
MANKQDSTPIRNWTEVERRLCGLFKSVSDAQTRIVNINNELTNIMKSLLINLADYMDQGEVSLWFYSGTPTTTNEPYTDWQDPSEHEGDFYYDRSVGAVYQFNGTSWTLIEDTQLLDAMAITNFDLAENDNERKLYLSQPVPPYEQGDWWIKENGDLWICQIDVAAGTPYNDIDFVPSSDYSMKQASRTANTLTVLKGTITEITEDYVKFTDLSTAGSTTIAGENITTGSIKSNNYSESSGQIQQGTKINLNDGSIKSKNWSLDSTGKMVCESATLKDVTLQKGNLTITDDGTRLGGNVHIQQLNNSSNSAELFSQGLYIEKQASNNCRESGICYTEQFGVARSRNSDNVTIAGIWGSIMEGAQIELVVRDQYSRTSITPSGVSPSSLQSIKKNFEKLENALEIVKNTDIYKYHLKSQEDTEKKHVGFVIGEDFNYSDIITNNDNTGAELYSMISVLWQAVKEQQIEIENLRKKEGEN